MSAQDFAVIFWTGSQVVSPFGTRKCDNLYWLGYGMLLGVIILADDATLMMMDGWMDG